MGPVWALLLLLPIAQGAETFCDLKTQTQCYGALGGIIQIQMMDNQSMIDRLKWTKKDLIFDWRNGNTRINDLQNRSKFFRDTGIFQLRNLSRGDTDSYKLEYFHKDGRLNKTFHHELIIEAPVSSLQLQHQCLSKGEVQVNWTSEGGDSPEFSCTLNGHNLTDSQLLSKNEENKTITLRQNTEGLLRCAVKNHVSEVNKTLQISSCGYIYINCSINGTQISDWVLKDTLCNASTTSAPITSVGKTSAPTPSTNQTLTAAPWYSQPTYIIAVAVAGLLFLGIVAIAVFCVLKRKSKNNNDEEHELTYADVRVIRQPGRRPQQQGSEMEVEYGQVKFPNQNRPVTEEPGDACLYAQVRR